MKFLKEYDAGPSHTKIAWFSLKFIFSSNTGTAGIDRFEAFSQLEVTR